MNNPKTVGAQPDLTVILCAYNEMGRIQPALDDLLSSLNGRSDSAEIIILDNCSTDGTREWLSHLSLPRVRVELNETNLGKGGSIKRGFALSQGKYVVIHDPDMEYRAADIWKLLDLARSQGAAMVLGSRVLGGKASYKYFLNYFGVRALTSLTNLLYRCRLTDTATAMKLLEGSLARQMKLASSGFDLDFELVARVLRLGGTMREARVEYHPRTKAQGKKIRAFRDGLAALKVILRDRLVSRTQMTK